MQKKHTLPTLKSLGVSGPQRKKFFAAIRSGDLATVTSMLADATPPDIFDVDGKAALSVAAYATENRSEIALALISAGADLSLRNESYHGGTLLHRFVKYPAVIQALLERGVDPAALDEHGCSPVYSAIKAAASERNALASADLLIDAGAPVQNQLKDFVVDTRGEERKAVSLHPVHLAASQWDADALRLLFSAGADTMLQSAAGTLPLQSAAAADPGAGLMGEFADVLEVFVQHGADVNAANARGQAALHTAITTKRPEQIKLLVERGAAIDTPVDAEGRTPWQLAKEQNDPEVLQILNAFRAQKAIDSIIKRAVSQP